MPYGLPLKRHYWAIVDRELNVMQNDETKQLWDDYGDCVQWFYKMKLAVTEFKIIKWTPMIKPENWK